MQVTHAFDGEEAYSIILEKGGPDAFDVILMDLHMPRKVSTFCNLGVKQASGDCLMGFEI